MTLPRLKNVDAYHRNGRNSKCGLCRHRKTRCSWSRSNKLTTNSTHHLSFTLQSKSTVPIRTTFYLDWQRASPSWILAAILWEVVMAFDRSIIGHLRVRASGSMRHMIYAVSSRFNIYQGQDRLSHYRWNMTASGWIWAKQLARGRIFESSFRRYVLPSGSKSFSQAELKATYSKRISRPGSLLFSASGGTSFNTSSLDLLLQSFSLGGPIRVTSVRRK